MRANSDFQAVVDEATDLLDLKSWYTVDIGDMTLYKAWNLERTGLVTHCFSTRRCGVSSPPYDTLNVALHVDDDRVSVIENRQRLANAAGIEALAITAAEQVHGSAVAVVTADDAGRGAEGHEHAMPGADALVTDSRGPILALFFADCVPVFILDPENGAVGLAHAGWKGTALGVAAEALRTMQEKFGTDPARCLAAIGPGIGRCCYNVSADVALNVYRAVKDDRVIARPSQDQIRLDLKLANWITLRSCGIREDNIALSDTCTACRPDEFFSYRRDGQTGRMAALFALR